MERLGFQIFLDSVLRPLASQTGCLDASEGGFGMADRAGIQDDQTAKLVAGNSNPALAQAIAQGLDLPLTKAVVRRFADNDLISPHADRHEVLTATVTGFITT